MVDDRGYNDYRLFAKWTSEGVSFVSRTKDNALYTVVETREVSKNRHFLKDEIILLTGSGAAEKCPYVLRRIEAYDPEKEQTLVFLTNNLNLGATTIGAIYRDRWQIELFFKALKQNLKIKTFVGTTANAVKIQIWTAMFVDTNLFVRYLTEDNPAKTDRVEALLTAASSGTVKLVTVDLVMAELIWVLESAYNLKPEKITPMIRAILSTPGMEVTNRAVVARALDHYQERKIDFVGRS